MPKSCSAYNCTNRYSSKNLEITFHRFPFSKPSVLKQWLDNIGRDDFQPRKHMVICSLHFTPDCFSGLGNRKNLLWNAVPTLFTLPSPNAKRRKSRKKLKMLEHVFPRCDEIAPERMLAHDAASQIDAEEGPEENEKLVSLGGSEPTIIEQYTVTQPQDRGPLDHTYALSDPCAAKVRLFHALDANNWLQRRLKIKCQVIKRIRLKLLTVQRELSCRRRWHNFTKARRGRTRLTATPDTDMQNANKDESTE